jgi:DNA replicative helicase MCM subunit Mcm2 (Cdc46/Mcm family)
MSDYDYDGGNGNGHSYGSPVIALEITDEILKEEHPTVTACYSSFSRGSQYVIIQMNSKYQNQIVQSYIDVEHWKETEDGLANVLKDNGVVQADRLPIQRMLNFHSARITEHFSRQMLEHMHAGQRAKHERKERMKSAPIKVSVRQASRMHDGNVEVRGMVFAGSMKEEKMYNFIGYRCENCDDPKILRDYRNSHPRSQYELPFIDEQLRKGKCANGCETFMHDQYDEVVNALRIELADEACSDLKGLDVVLLDRCVEDISFGEEIIVRGSVQRITDKGKAFSCVFVGLDSLKDAIPNPVEHVDKKESIELTEKDVEEMQEFAQKNVGKGKILNKLSELFSPSTLGPEYKHLKKCMLLAIANSGRDRVGVGRKRRGKGRRIHVLVIGDTGLRKTGILEDAIRAGDPNSRFASAADSTPKTLIAVHDNDSGTLRLGPVTLANNAICAIDEIGRMHPEDQARLLSALQQGVVDFGRHGFTKPLPAYDTFILSANPKNSTGNFRHPDKIDPDEIPFIGPLRDRIDLVCVLRTNRTMNHALNFAFKKMAMMNNPEGTSDMEKQNDEFLSKYFLYTKKFDPRYSRKSGNKIALYYTEVHTKQGSKTTPRLFETLYNLGRAIATINQHDIVSLEDVEEVIEIYNEQLSQHLSKLVDMPSDTRDLAVEEAFKVLEKLASKFGYDYIELLKIVCEKVEWVSYFIGFGEEGKRDWSPATNKHLREIRDRLKEAAEKNDRIVVVKKVPLILAWKDTYVYSGDDTGIGNGNNNGNGNGNNGASEIDQIDQIDLIDQGSDPVKNMCDMEKDPSSAIRHDVGNNSDITKSGGQTSQTSQSSQSQSPPSTTATTTLIPRTDPNDPGCNDCNGGEKTIPNFEDKKSHGPFGTQGTPSPLQGSEEVVEDYKAYVARQRKIFNTPEPGKADANPGTLGTQGTPVSYKQQQGSDSIQRREQDRTTIIPIKPVMIEGVDPVACIFCDFVTCIELDLRIHLQENHRMGLVELPIGKGPMPFRIEYAVNEGRQKAWLDTKVCEVKATKKDVLGEGDKSCSFAVGESQESE